MKLWQKDNTELSALVERFTVGKDRDFDLLLAKHDVNGSLAHVAMLEKVGLLSAADHVLVKEGLEDIRTEIERGSFTIDNTSEDIHSQIELLLTERVGEAGKKIHSGRSRNDQVAVDIKLYLREELAQIKTQVLSLFDLLIELSERHKNKLLPGYTHLQVAMPSSFGLWFGAYAESLTDDMRLLMAVYDMVNRNPLGSGAGYGSSMPLNRTMTTDTLGFAGLHYNSVYAQMSRGKTERFVAVAISAIAATLSRMSMDICLYMSQNFGFISFPPEYTTGSSIMPHKKNPDIFELLRGRCNRIQSLPNELALLGNNLPSGYHRDMQLTKEILFPGIESLKACLEITVAVLSHVEVRDNILEEDKYRYIFTVEKVNELTRNGMPFRDAYKQVGNEVEQGTFEYAYDGLYHTHEGSTGNLCNDQIVAEMRSIVKDR